MKNKNIFIFTSLDCVERINEYVVDTDFELFNNDKKTQDAVLRNLEVLGQSLKDYGVDDLIIDYPQIDWKAIAGMRNIIAHEYLSIDIAIIWETIVGHISPLESTIKEICDSIIDVSKEPK